MGSKNNDIFSKFRRKLTQEDETSVEIREDEEQGTKLQEIIDLLVASGYFRARIKGLSSFDKVVGGMTWCIESCNVDLDVDLLFQENSTIGQKIALTEKIVAVLPKLKCPHLIEPHQIQGLDFINIFPVIQWLVKRSMEHRQEVAKSVRSYAVNQFDKDFSKTDVEQEKKVAELRKNVQTVQEIYRPRRTHRLKGAPPKDLKTRIEVTLLEYGGCASAPGTSGDSLTAENELNMTQTDLEDYSFENLTEEEKTKVRKHYNALHMELEDGGIQSEEMRKLDELEETLSFLEAQVDRLKTLKENTETELETSQKLVVALTKKQIEANEALEELQSQQNNQKVAEIEQLVIQNDTLRAKETDYKEHCKKELKRIQALIEDAKTSKATPSTSNDLTLELEEESRKLKQLKLHLAKKNRLVSSLKRQIDEAPSRSELTQYQRRFLELYNQISAKHKETKQYYTLYNTLEDTKMYMKKELSLLNSIFETYPESLLTSGGKEEFLEQFQAILNGVKQSKHKLELKLAEGKRNRATLSYLLHGLTDLQRKYVAACRELSFKCKEFEQLSQNT